MIRNVLLIVAVLAFFQFTILAQNQAIIIEADQQALNELLHELRDSYGFQLSFNENALAGFTISLHGSYTNKKDALKAILDQLPFQIQQSGEVLIIVPNKKAKQETPPPFRFSGQIVERGSREPLPYSHIIINNQAMVSDVMGAFNYTATADSIFRLQISHLGYFIFDTLLYASIDKQFELSPSQHNLPEITILQNTVERATLPGDRPGKMKLNTSIAGFLPGQGDNSVFNLLRLMPGIQAAGEQASDLLIWGSYEGQSQVSFDGFTLFGLKNFNDNISVVNPFLVKNIEIHKGGYDARYGNRVGGLILISGKNGDFSRPVFSFNINNTTLNGMAEIPLFGRSSLIFAYRQTYYKLYNSDDFNIFAPTRPVLNSDGKGNTRFDTAPDINVYPNDYQFRDANLKYTLQLSNNDLFYISLYAGGDYFGLDADASLTRSTRGRLGRDESVPLEVMYEATEDNRQNGGSMYYHRTWSNGAITRATLSSSAYSKSTSELTAIDNLSNGTSYSNGQKGYSNDASEHLLRIEHLIPAGKGHQLETGTGFFFNQSFIGDVTSYNNVVSIDTSNQYADFSPYVYLNDQFPLSEQLSLNAGLRTSYLLNRKQLLAEPRVSLKYELNKQFKINASWGLFNQYMYLMGNVDRELNYTYLWVTANKQLPALQSQHIISGLSYHSNGFTFNIEAYHKKTEKLSRRVQIPAEQERTKGQVILYRGDAKAFGIDTYIKKEIGKHSLWASYTLSTALERLAAPQMALPEYTPAPHNQNHEVKLSALFYYRQFFFSANYVYGSGIHLIEQAFDDTSIDYHRVDAALTYQFGNSSVKGESGISVLNLLDTHNLKHDNLRKITISRELGAISLYTEAVPFTPVLFFKLIF
jgi:hypothetical protein